MMVKPTKAELLEKTDSKFRLVIATAKRARQIANGHEKLVNTKEEAPVTIHFIYSSPIIILPQKT